MKKYLATLSMAFVVVLAGVGMVSCGNSASGARESGSSAQSASAGGLQNGTYLATYANVDAHGWQEFLEVKAQGNNITSVTFDAINAKGELKTNDANYNATMKKLRGTNPDEFTTALEKNLLVTQAAPVDVVTGATESSKDFNELATKILAAAQTGDTAPIVLPQNATYAANGTASRYGWTPTVSITFTNGKMTDVKVDQVKIENNRITARQSTDAAFQTQYRKGTGKEITAVFNRLDTELLQSGDPAKVDVVSSATEISNEFKTLARKIISERVSVSPATITSAAQSSR